MKLREVMTALSWMSMSALEMTTDTASSAVARPSRVDRTLSVRPATPPMVPGADTVEPLSTVAVMVTSRPVITLPLSTVTPTEPMSRLNSRVRQGALSTTFSRMSPSWSPPPRPSARRLEPDSMVIQCASMETSPAAPRAELVPSAAPDSMVMFSATTVRSRPFREVVPLKVTSPGLISLVFRRPALMIRSKLTVPRSVTVTVS